MNTRFNQHIWNRIKQIVLLIVVGLLVSCGSSSSSKDPGSGQPPDTQITSGDQAAAVAAQGLVGALGNVDGDPPIELAPGLSAQNAAQSVIERVFPGFSQALQAAKNGNTGALASVLRAPVSGTESCPDGGSMSYSGDDGVVTGIFDVTVTFSDCLEGTETINGTVRFVYDTTNFIPFTFTLNATMSDSSGAFMSFNNYSFDVRDTTLAGATNPIAITFNGSVSMDDGAGNSFTFQAYNYQTKIGIRSDLAGYLLAINGTLSWDMTPDVCGEGTYTVVTTTTLNYDIALRYFIAGVMTINGNTTITFNSNGTVTVTVDGVAYYYDDYVDLQAATCSV